MMNSDCIKDCLKSSISLIKDGKMGGLSSLILKTVVKQFLPKIVDLYGKEILDAIVQALINAVDGIED